MVLIKTCRQKVCQGIVVTLPPKKKEDDLLKPVRCPYPIRDWGYCEDSLFAPRWASTSYQWSYGPFKWPYNIYNYKWASGATTAISGGTHFVRIMFDPSFQRFW